MDNFAVIFKGTLAEALQSKLVLPGSRLLLRGGTYTGDFVNQLSDVGVLPYPSETPMIDGSMLSMSADVLFDRLIITDLDFTNRTSAQAGSEPTDLTSITAARGMASNIEFRDCIIHNTLQGAYCPDEATVTFDGCIVFYNGWDAPDRGHGHGIYGQKDTTIKNCILFSNFGYGIHVYGEGVQSVDNATIENNISFCNGTIAGTPKGNILTGKPSSTIKNPVWRNNYTYHPATVPNRFGYTSSHTGGVLTDNYMPDGCTITDGLLTSSGNVFEPEQINRVFIVPVRDRLHVVIYNWQMLDKAKVEVPFTGTVQARNVQDYFNDILTLEVVNGAIEIPMTGHTVAAPVGWTAPATTFPQFGCFVLVAA